MKLFKIFSVIVAISLALSSCDKLKGVDIEYYSDEELEVLQSALNLPNNIVNYQLDFPDYTFTNPPQISSSLATLGRVLFYDTDLSSTRDISCASCHKQEVAFGDDLQFSEGINGHFTKRNSLALGSVFNFRVYYGGNNGIPFMWDNAFLTAQEQATAALRSEEEMGMNALTMVQRVKDKDYYNILFEKAYGEDAVVTDVKLIDAIAEFVNSMGSFDSKFDQALESKFDEAGTFFDDNQLINTNFNSLTNQENLGLNIYVQNCASCHSASLGRPVTSSENNGIDDEYGEGFDNGIGDLAEFSNNESYKGLFKVPTLRNIAKTAPYMHDGRFETLEEVVEHYSSGIKNHPNLSTVLRTGNSWDEVEAKQMNFTTEEKQALVAFMETLTDESFISAEKYSNPFK